MFHLPDGCDGSSFMHRHNACISVLVMRCAILGRLLIGSRSATPFLLTPSFIARSKFSNVQPASPACVRLAAGGQCGASGAWSTTCCVGWINAESGSWPDASSALPTGPTEIAGTSLSTAVRLHEMFAARTKASSSSNPPTPMASSRAIATGLLRRRMCPRARERWDGPSRPTGVAKSYGSRVLLVTMVTVRTTAPFRPHLPAAPV